MKRQRALFLLQKTVCITIVSFLIIFSSAVFASTNNSRSNYSLSNSTYEVEIAPTARNTTSHSEHQSERFSVTDNSLLSNDFFLLDGKWDYFEKSLVDPSLFYPEYQLDVGKKITLPHTFPKDVCFATYHCRICNLKPDTSYGMFVYRKILSSARIYCNEELVSTIGLVNREKKLFRPAQSMKIIELTSDSNGEIDIVLHLMDYSTGIGGINDMLKITEIKYLENIFSMNICFEVVIVGLLLAVVLYNVILLLSNNFQKIYLWLCLLSISLILVCMTMGFSLAVYLIPKIPFFIERKLYIISATAMVPLLLLCIKEFYVLKSKSILVAIFLGLALFAYTVFVPIKFFEAHITVLYVIFAVALILVAIFLLSKIRRTHYVYGINLLFFCLFVAFIIYDFIFTGGFDFGKIKYFWSKCVIILLSFEQATVVAYRRSVIIQKIEKVTKKMEVSNNSSYSFLPKGLIQQLHATSIDEMNIGSCVTENAMIFCANIYNFSAISENLSAEETFNFLTPYYNIVWETIQNYSGFVTEYVADKIIAIFPKMNDMPCQAAIKVQEELKKVRKTLRRQGMPDLFVGIRISAGNVSYGITGNDIHFDAITISDEIDVLSKIESQNKKLNSNILVTEKAMPYCRSYADCIFNGRTVVVKGTSVVLYSATPIAPLEADDFSLEEVRDSTNDDDTISALIKRMGQVVVKDISGDLYDRNVGV